MKGQINLDSQAGQEIVKIVNRNDILNIVESGTWNGGGTTTCVLSFLKDNQEFYSIELYDDMYHQAQINLESFMNRSNFHLIKGSIINYDDIFWFDHNSIDFKNDGHARLWFNRDLENLKKSKNICDKLPNSIDLLILDGGEYSTYPEWIKLKERTKIVFLDDTNLFKTKKIREELLKDTQYKILVDMPEDRNGFAIFERIE